MHHFNIASEMHLEYKTQNILMPFFKQYGDVNFNDYIQNALEVKTQIICLFPLNKEPLLF